MVYGRDVLSHFSNTNISILLLSYHPGNSVDQKFWFSQMMITRYHLCKDGIMIVKILSKSYITGRNFAIQLYSKCSKPFLNI